MEFGRPFFTLIFLPIAILLYYFVKLIFKNNSLAKNICLLVLSLIFYSFGGLIFLGLTLCYLLLIYIFGFLINKNNKVTIILFLIISLSYLIAFKVFEVTFEGIVLPLAISFIAFQSYAYLMDVYKEKIPVEKNIVNFLAYSLLFTKLISGPIMRYASISEQMTSRNENSTLFVDGVIRFAFGLFKKIIIAGFIYPLVSNIYSLELTNLTTLAAWIGILAYALFLYYDFSSYSDMAVGISRMFGFEIVENFNYPYTSFSITDFWRRWHISLSLWFKEYVYIPLGGNRKGKLRTFLNVAIIFLLTGIWHGFKLTFLVWGVYFALIMIIEKAFLLDLLNKNKFKPLNVLYCFIVVIIGWVIFSAKDLPYAFNYLAVMFGKNFHDPNRLLDYFEYKSLIGFLLGFLFIGFIQRPLKPMLEKYRDNTFWRVGTVVLSIGLIVISMIFAINGTYSPSIYGGF